MLITFNYMDFQIQMVYFEMFADARYNDAYPAIVKVKLFVCIGEMISFRYGTRIPANLAQ